MTNLVAPPLSNPQAETFGYVCHRCRKCCHHQNIQLNPYEVARLARNRGLTTSEFRAAWTVEGAGLHLAQTDSGACVFLGDEGCTVHPDRPLVCRLYPLGRSLIDGGKEVFFHVKTHPQSHGEFTRTGTIADFLLAQGAHAFMQAADDYYYWLRAAGETLDKVIGAEGANISKEDEHLACDLLDMDSAITRHSLAAGVAEPTDIEARRQLHLKILYDELEAIEGAQHGRT